MDNTTRFLIGAGVVTTAVMFLILGALVGEMNMTNQYEKAVLTLCNESPYPVSCMDRWDETKIKYDIE